MDWLQSIMNGLAAGIGLGFAEWFKERKTKKFMDYVDKKIMKAFKRR